MPHSSLAMTASQPSQSPHHPNPATHPGSHHNGHGHEEHLVNALHAALNSLSHSDITSHAYDSPLYTPGSQLPPPPVSAKGEKTHTNLDIQLTSDVLTLRGTGVDVEPALLQGNVVLTLGEPTSIRQIVLQFRGKARVPTNPNDPHVLNNSPQQYLICNHEWTFLEGEKKQSHTLKAGRHLFPFELRLGGSLPSTLATYVNGGASISYKLRATAVRPGFAPNLSTVLPVTILRSFAPEALEYQQTLEIENTWPEKVMYALMIPHKAWAAGDELSVLLKFAPLVKGVRVISVTTQLCETTKTLSRGGHLEKTRTVVTRKHEIIDGHAVDENQKRRMMKATGGLHEHEVGLTPLRSGESSPGYPAGGATSAFVSGTTTPIHEFVPPPPGSSSTSTSGPSSANTSFTNIPSLSSSGFPPSSSSSSNNHNPHHTHGPALDEDGTFDSEVTTTIKLALPATLTPSHALDPILVNYRVRWSVLLANLDGHTSELRCSLPIHILDFAVRDEARAATRATRRLLFGGEEGRTARGGRRRGGERDGGVLASNVPDPEGGEGEGEEGVEGEEDDEGNVLPSYPSHVRDRVAMAMAVDPVAAGTSGSVDGMWSVAATPAVEIGSSNGEFPGLTVSGSGSLPVIQTNMGQQQQQGQGQQQENSPGPMSAPGSFTFSHMAAALGQVGRSRSGTGRVSPPSTTTSATQQQSTQGTTQPSSAESSRPTSQHGNGHNHTQNHGHTQSQVQNQNHGHGHGHSSGGWRSLMSRAGSRANSRAPSPERFRSQPQASEAHDHSHLHHHEDPTSIVIPTPPSLHPSSTIVAASLNASTNSNSTAATPSSRPIQTYIHSSNASTRNSTQPPGVFSVLMKPVTPGLGLSGFSSFGGRGLWHGSTNIGSGTGNGALNGAHGLGSGGNHANMLAAHFREAAAYQQSISQARERELSLGGDGNGGGFGMSGRAQSMGDLGRLVGGGGPTGLYAPSHSHSHSGSQISYPTTPGASTTTSAQPSTIGSMAGFYSVPQTPDLFFQSQNLQNSNSMSAVPDYFVAQHGGAGVPPLETLRGLPTYEDSEAAAAADRAVRPGQSSQSGQVGRSGGGSGREGEEGDFQRSFSDSDLVGRFTAATSAGSSTSPSANTASVGAPVRRPSGVGVGAGRRQVSFVR